MQHRTIHNTRRLQKRLSNGPIRRKSAVMNPAIWIMQQLQMRSLMTMAGPNTAAMRKYRR